MDGQIVQAFSLIRRNRLDCPFPGKMTADEKTRHIQWVRDALEEAEGFRYLGLREAERWRGTHPFSAFLSKGGGTVWAHDAGLSVIADGEDGVIFRYESGDARAEEACRWAESRLFASESPAVTEKFGHLTAQPVLSGLGMQRVYVLHLPVLRTLRQLRVRMDEVQKLGCALLPAEEEENNTTALYAVVNAKGAAADEKALAEKVRQAAMGVAEKEGLLAARMMASSTSRLADEAGRAYGILRFAERLSAREWRTLWSQLRMGAEQGLVPVGLKALDALLLPVLYPENEEKENNKQVARAQMVRRFLKEEDHADFR